MKKLTREQTIDLTLFLLRLAAYAIFLGAGGMKLFGWFGGIPGGVNSLLIVAGILEVFGGLLVALGLFTRITAFILSGEMAFAYFMGHVPMGIYPHLNQGGPAFLLCFIFLFISAYGAGKISLDQLIKRRKISRNQVV